MVGCRCAAGRLRGARSSRGVWRQTMRRRRHWQIRCRRDGPNCTGRGRRSTAGKPSRGRRGPGRWLCRKDGRPASRETAASLAGGESADARNVGLRLLRRTRMPRRDSSKWIDREPREQPKPPRSSCVAGPGRCVGGGAKCTRWIVRRLRQQTRSPGEGSQWLRCPCLSPGRDFRERPKLGCQRALWCWCLLSCSHLQGAPLSPFG